jgi:pyruvate,water dikinase
VVQQMVASEVAGVLFTANPVTGARDEIVVDASPGLGEAVVSGLVTPDHHVLRRQTWGWRVVERRLGRREVVVRPRAAGGTEQIVEDRGRAAQRAALTDRDLRRLARLGVAIERHFGRPQDIEWALAGGRFFILQARPITALPPPAPRANVLTRTLASLVAELLPARPYPLEVTTWGPGLMIAALLGPLLQLLGLQLHTDRLFAEEDGVIVRFTGRLPVRPTPLMVFAPLRLLRLARRYDVARWQEDPLLAEGIQRARSLERRDPQTLSWEGLLATVREALANPYLLGELRVRYMAGAILGYIGLELMLALLGRADSIDALLAGIETRTLEANGVLEGLARQTQSDPFLRDAFSHFEPGQLWSVLDEQPSGRAFLQALRAFLDKYGHREAGGTLLVSQATWKEAPEVVLGILKGLALAPAAAQTRAPNWQAARDEQLKHRLLRVPPLRSMFLALLTRARYFAQLREDTRFYATMVLPILHRSLMDCGRRLAAASVLDTSQDVFHLKFEELEEIDGVWPPPPALASALRAKVARRKQLRTELEGTPLVDPRSIRRGEPESGVLVRGTSGSPGIAEGPVRVIHDASEFGRLQPGAVLVAPYTNPAWTPLFQRAAAVVVDSGGAMSHAAIVAREYGIPAVMGTVDATRRLIDGQRIRVDGARGVVIPLGDRGH